MTVHIHEHGSYGYPPRTKFNAENACLTIAFTVNPNTPGERATRKYATDAKYGHIDLNTEVPVSAARLIAHFIRSKLNVQKPKVVNIAGNGIQTLSLHGWTQERINAYLIDTFRILSDFYGAMPIQGFRSGGQTGVDIAAAVMAKTLDVDAVITLPKGFMQRDADGKDVALSKESIGQQIDAMSEMDGQLV